VILVNSGDSDEASAIKYTQRWIAGKRFSCGHTCVQAGVNHYECDEAAARKSYETFLDLWKDADADLPIYQQAKAEYARLEKERRTN